MSGLLDAPFFQNVAVPAVCLLIIFLGYGSQLAFNFLELSPGPPSRSESITFNVLLLLLWLTYFRAVTVDPGRYVFADRVVEVEGRWCSKCEAPKPLRSHHCRNCRRCVPKMDHHCPWTRNCVSMTTFPHFLRFLVYTNVALWMLGYLLWQRLVALWESRLLPSYLGPTLPGLVSLSMISLVYALTALALGIMLVTTVRSWALNQTLIESWEAERHEALAARGGRDWWDVEGPDGEKFRFEKLEFPYDIGFYANMSQAMGTSNFLLWFWPLAGNPTVDKSGSGTGWDWEENGFNRIEGLWPPLDPEKMRRAARAWPAARRDFNEELRIASLTPEQMKAEVKKRQAEDQRRRNHLLAELEEVDYDVVNDNGEPTGQENLTYEQGFDGKPGWTNSDGERLGDYGVDEDADLQPVDQFEDEDVPLAEIVRRRKVLRKGAQEK